MKVNDYIRTIKYGIRKIEMVIDEPDRKGVRFNDTDGWNKGVPEEEIIKYSPNIIDLIEVGDYVNGGKVYYCYCADEDSTGLFIDTEKGREWLDKSNQIKSIVTKEQFESMEYKVKE
jgi:hypothetical protein